MSQTITKDTWQNLRIHTDARIALGRAGDSLPTSELLAFQMAHAQARDAIHSPFAPQRILDDIAGEWDTITVKSAAHDRAEYLQRPDKGRILAKDEAQRLAAHKSDKGYDIVFIVGDGLSSTAVHENAAPLLKAMRRKLPDERSIAPLVLAYNARVFLTDPIAESLNAKLALILIGERPGLSSPNSLGAYLTYAPKTGMQNHDRNVISNIRPEGLDIERAACHLVWLMEEARSRGISGVALKGDPPPHIFAKTTKQIV